MRVLFVSHNDLDSNSGIHIFNLANHLVYLGVDCSVCVPKHKESVKTPNQILFDVIDFDEAKRKKKAQAIDIIHAWTPRESVRLMTEQLSQIYQCPYLVHLEDNEEALLAATLGKTFA